jgi:hypothetical protein
MMAFPFLIFTSIREAEMKRMPALSTEIKNLHRAPAREKE